MPTDSHTKPHAYKARWIFTAESEPIENGFVSVDAGGRIAEVGRQVPRGAVDLGRVALIPGLVNAHTHLEFCGLARPLEPAQPFDRWIRSVVSYRQGRSEPVDAIIGRGLDESARAGTTLLGEIATSDLPPQAYRAGGPAVVVFRELLATTADRIEAQLEIARRHLESASVEDDDAIRGISPHAPYTVHRELFFRLVDLAKLHKAPLAIHLAETRAELELLDRGRGPLVEMLRAFGIWESEAVAPGSRPLDYLQPLAGLERALVIHGNYLQEDELRFLADHKNLTLVYCPRTHAYFGHAAHPWRMLLERGGQVALGTDSRASNPDLSVWRELCFLRERHHDVPPTLLLELGTIRGARALGLAKQTGSLTLGKRADLAVVSLSPSGDDPWSAMFQADQRLLATMRFGQWVYRHRSLRENWPNGNH